MVLSPNQMWITFTKKMWGLEYFKIWQGDVGKYIYICHKSAFFEDTVLKIELPERSDACVRDMAHMPAQSLRGVKPGCLAYMATWLLWACLFHLRDLGLHASYVITSNLHRPCKQLVCPRLAGVYWPRTLSLLRIRSVYKIFWNQSWGCGCRHWDRPLTSPNHTALWVLSAQPRCTCTLFRLRTWPRAPETAFMGSANVHFSETRSQRGSTFPRRGRVHQRSGKGRPVIRARNMPEAAIYTTAGERCLVFRCGRVGQQVRRRVESWKKTLAVASTCILNSMQQTI